MDYLKRIKIKIFFYIKKLILLFQSYSLKFMKIHNPKQIKFVFENNMNKKERNFEEKLNNNILDLNSIGLYDNECKNVNTFIQNNNNIKILNCSSKKKI
jgi:hypothetical protein